jgi:hypothetical protein
MNDIQFSRRAVTAVGAIFATTACGRSSEAASARAGSRARSESGVPPCEQRLYLNVRDFGAKGDGTGDDLPAIARALQHLRQANSARAPGEEMFAAGGTLYFPAGRYHCSATLSLKQQVRLLGEARGSGNGGATQLVFPPDVTGILINRENTDDQNGGAPSSTSAEGSIIEGMALAASGTPSGASGATGIYARARCTLLRCDVSGFARDGIALVANEAMPQIGNCNASVLRDCSVQHNGRHGLWIAGDNANACIIENLNAVLNGAYGFCDITMVGQSWIGGHSASNGQLLSGPFRATAIVWWKGAIYALLPGDGHADRASRIPPDRDPALWSLREQGVHAPFPDIPQWSPGMALTEGGAGYIGAGRHVHVNPYTEGRQGPYVNNGALALGGSPGAGFVGRGVNVYASEGQLTATGASGPGVRAALDAGWARVRRTFGLS